MLAVALAAGAARAQEAGFARVDGASFETAIPPGPRQKSVTLRPFLLQVHPVTNAEFLAFAARHPEWRRDQVPAVFAEPGYLSHWEAPLELGPGAGPEQPVTNVSWFAAQAYCEAGAARLPTWHEWEWAAAADETRRDARGDSAWRQRMLDAELRPKGAELPPVAQGPANVYGIRDLYGLVSEWVQEVASLVVDDAGRAPDAGEETFCGAAAPALAQTENYAVQLRVAMLRSLAPASSTRLLGFRCARDLPGKAP